MRRGAECRRIGEGAGRSAQLRRVALGLPWLLACASVSPVASVVAPSAAATAATTASVSDPGHGSTPLAPGVAGASELSGLVWAGADTFYAISDSGAALYELDVDIDPASGAILSASVVGVLSLASGSDHEGVVHHPLGGSVLTADESGPAIREYRLSDGAELSSVTLPPIFAQARANLSLESLAQRVAASASDDALWTANEEALTVDGPISDASSGTLVRLQRFDASLAPAGQWAYRTDPYPGSAFLGQERSGVADLLALPNGELLVLERSFSSALFRARLYRVDFSDATDVSSLASLASGPFTPLSKTLLWERGGVFENFEGLTLGPELDAGDRSLLLVSDDGGGALQSLYPLRISYVPEPGATAQVLAGLLLLAGLAQRRRDALRAADQRPRPIG